MASRRKEPLKRRDSDASLFSMALILVLLFFVAFKVDDEVTSEELLLHCRSTCNDLHIQSAAMSNPYPPSSSMTSGSVYSTIDTLFLRRKLDEEQSDSFRPSVMSSTPLASKSSPQVRPRRLPTLIKVLTGYDDEPYWNFQRSTDRLGRTHTPAIAYVDKPKIEPSQHQKRKRRVRSDDTVQIAAAAAATAVWSQSTSTFGSCRMNRVNSEWDAALRWIAGWDSTNNMSEDMSLNDWANHLVDNLTAVLEECIEKCSRGEDFGFTHYIEQDGVNSFAAVKRVSSSIGDVIWRSIFGWAFGKSLRLSTSFGSLDAMIQVIASTAAVYVIHSLWSSGWPVITDWFRSLRYFEAPDEWLIQHEKELELAKSSRARQKKGKKSKKKQKQKASAKKSILDKDSAKNKSLDSTSGYEGSVRNFNDVTSSAVDEDVVPATDFEYADIHEDQSGFVKPNTKAKFAVSKDSAGSSMSDGVPSVISLSSTTSVTSSPSIKPSSPSPTNVPENGTLESHAAFSSSIVRSGVYSQHLPGKNAFAVPTVEQRNEAANQLRDFQNAQIRRLVLQKQQKLAQDGRFNHPGSNSAATVPFGGNVSGQAKRVVKPPPGFSAFTPVSQDRYPSNLDENELLLSKLLDDEDDDEVEDTNVSLPVSTGSSLDPSAKPFFASDEGEQRHRLEPRSSKANDQWSGKIKGVYGGNVW
mmetsp:Transcript_1302/g.1800  ORF Transcript_1302/g.1800 Transcript_1302/m.1800 type:complete len:694 (-) Transcript_1302:102-2183(-)